MKLLTINDVIERVSFKKTKLYNWIREGKFPKPISIADTRSVRWIDTEVQQWINEQISGSRNNMDFKTGERYK